jgi:hypothetical protein
MENKYKQIEGVWYVTDKNGVNRKVTSKKILQELSINSETNEMSIDTTIDDGTKQISGLGDVIEKVTSFFGIKKCDECERRRQEFNKRYPWTNYENMEKLSQEEDEILAKAKESPIVPYEIAKAIFDIYNKHYKPRTPVKFCQCGGLFKTMLERLTLLSTAE